MWNNRYDFLPTHEPIIVSKLACNLEYMAWFRIHGKPYLYGEEVRRRYPHTSRPRRPPLNPRVGEASPSSMPTLDSWTSIPDVLHVHAIYFSNDVDDDV
ncbi:hypothetical protein Goshw_023254 [Gossypium schwendimanii]|uniref:Uncharacterized protein n=1 Tax=Gossypium schwendimanii TaxID=34291 RepID=A0A7J9LXK5_GOSSC|nr:hypothetical protein [Gossypium schwendimanii]